MNASLNSNSCALANLEIAFSRIMKSLLILILSKALGFARRVLSPKRMVHSPAKVTTGLIPFL